MAEQSCPPRVGDHTAGLVTRAGDDAGSLASGPPPAEPIPNSGVAALREAGRTRQGGEPSRRDDPQFLLAIEDAAIGMALLGPDGRILRANDSLCRFFGRTEPELLATDFRSITHPEDREADPSQLRRLLAGTIRSYRLEKRYLHKGGEVIWGRLSLAPVRDAGGRPSHLVAQVEDVTALRLAEETLRASEARFRAFAGHRAGAASFGDEAGRRVFASRTTEQLAGGERGELPGRADDARVRARGPAVGHVERAGGMAFDIAEHRRAEEALRRSETRLQAVLDSSDAVTYLKDLQGRYQMINRRWAELFGVTRESVVGRTDHELFPPQIADAFRANDLRALEAGRAIEMEEVAPHDDGPHTYLSIKAPLFDASGAAYATCGISTDITARKRMEQALREGESTLRSFYDSPPLLMGVVELEGDDIRLVSVNAATAAVLGRTVEEVQGRLVGSLGVGPEELAMWTGRYRQACREGRPVRFKFSRTTGESPSWHVAVVGPIAGSPSGRPRLSFVVEDVTVLEHAEREAKALRERLECRLGRIAALRRIDLAIGSWSDLARTLGIVAKEALGQLSADAACVLLCDQESSELSYAAGAGFRTLALRHTRLRPGEGPAGHAARERRVVRLPDLDREPDDLACSPWLAEEGFIAYHAAPMMAKGRCLGVLEVFHRAAFEPDGEWSDYLETLAGQAAIAADGAGLYEGLQLAHRELTLAYDATIEGWARALDLRDEETEGHSRRVTELAVRLAEVLGVSGDELLHIRRGALLHDIGKMGIPDGILLKPGKLTDEEWAVMKRHPTYAHEMLRPIGFLGPALDIPYCHHERWDGTGYPRGLKGEEIPLAARIFAAADIYDALTSDRPYRAAWEPRRALEHVRSLAGTHLDPRIVAAFLRDMAGGTDPAGLAAPSPAAAIVGTCHAAPPAGAGA